MSSRQFSWRTPPYDETLSHHRYEEMVQQSLLPRFGSSKPPKLVTPATTLPSTPAIPDYGDRRPSLTYIQLIALAILNHARRTPTGNRIFEWIQWRFKYYQLHPRALARVRTKLSEIYDDYDPPVVPLSRKYKSLAMPWEAHFSETNRYAIVVGHLSTIFPASQGIFPLMHLPTELRLSIYEYALSMPCNEWTKTARRFIPKKAEKRSSSRLVSPLCIGTDYRWLTHAFSFWSLPTDTILALLQTSKQVHYEAAPIFYRLHSFSRGDKHIGEFPTLLSGIHGFRRTFLRTVTIYYINCGADHKENDWTAEFELLKQCEGLEVLTLRLPTYPWYGSSYPWYGNSQYGSVEDVSNYPGFEALITVRGLKELRVVCELECIMDDAERERRRAENEKIEGYLKPFLTLPREDPVSIHGNRRIQSATEILQTIAETSETSKKRKADTELDNEEEVGEGSESLEATLRQSKKERVGTD